MKKEYDFSKSVKNPYFETLKTKQITLEVEAKTLENIEQIAKQKGTSLKALINQYLIERVRENLNA